MIYAIYISLIFIRKTQKEETESIYRLQLGLCVMHASKHMWERMKKYKKEYVKTESEVRER